MATNTNKTPIVAAILGVAGLILVTVLSISLAHTADNSVHPEKKELVTKPEFNQFQERVMDGITDLKGSQRRLQDSLDELHRGIHNR